MRFAIEAVPEGDALRVKLRRDGALPADVAWSSFQFLVPIARYGGTTVLADGKQLTLPTEKPQNMSIVGGAKRLVLAPGDAQRYLEIACDAGVYLNDARQWDSPMYQIGIPLDGGPRAEASFLLRFAQGSPEQLRPRLCISHLGYSAGGLKEVTMEWPKGTNRPADGVKIQDSSRRHCRQRPFRPDDRAWTTCRMSLHRSHFPT